ncbi:hypothetical protein BUALT_Bualt15G0036300 [Buddleja alternifolia]|uniref:TF-B3 domain-containing protein n=1 Tax=Buddleja alternifolia TaxID=168488 RepID=A0AAV6WE28_9LAMI|nr:hypothetical protein BUALT_Bualt15G0036300 [Buddleja alternifolia]
MELGGEENRASKKPKIVESDEGKQGRMDDTDNPMRRSSMERAEEIRANLSLEFPSFSKPVLNTHASDNRFRFYLPRGSVTNLPSYDYTVVLVDENGKEYQAKYSAQRHTIDGGRNGFSKTHKLLEGDALVFHLIDYCKFKVYIVRATESSETLTPPNSVFHAKPIDTDDDTENSSSDIPKNPRIADKFKEVKGFKDVNIIVGDLILDSDIPENTRKYQEKILEQARMDNMDNPAMSDEAKVNRSSEPHSCVCVMSSAMERAEKIQSNLSPEFPSFSKSVLKSHITRFRVCLPREFMTNLPSHDCTVILVDENGKEYQVKYSIKKHRIDGGTSGFSFSKIHKLLEGDALVFHLTDYCKFKVYIVRATEGNETLTPRNSDFHAKPNDTDDQLVSDTDNFSSDILRSPRSSDEFKEVKSFEDFNVIVRGLILNSEIPIDTGQKYYELCCSQKMFLHDNLVEGLSSKLVADMITETVNIIDAIRVANISTSLHNLKCWDKTLKGFEVLGMSVGYLRARIHKLIRLSCEFQETIEAKREKRARREDEIEALKELINSLEGELVALEVKNEKLGFEFMEVAGTKAMVLLARMGDTDTPMMSNEANVNRSSDPHSCVRAKTSAVERAEEIRSNLSPKFPSFSKHVYIVRATKAIETLIPRNSDFHVKPIDTDDQLISNTESSSSDSRKAPEIQTSLKNQKMFLRGNLIEGLSGKLAVNRISEPINMVDAIRAANISTSLHNLKCWDKTLKGFEVLGMSVGFLRARIHKLIRLSCEFQEMIETKREKRARLDEELEALKAAVSKIEELMNSLEGFLGNARKRTRYGDLYDDVEAKFTVMERAERVLSRLENELPHFVKCMLPSNVAHGFWLHLPAKFCSIHLPNHDTSIVLVDEWGNEYKTSYLLDRHGLSAGWRGFSISHRLLKGDILIFHLTEPCKLKVHIVRVNGSDVVSAALCLMNLDASARGTDSGLIKKDNRKRKKTKYVDPFTPDISTPPKNVKGKNAANSILAPVTCQSASNSDGFSSEVLEGSETTNRPQPNDLCYPETSFLHDHSREVVTCR